MNSPKIHSFTDLNVWKEGHIFIIQLYKITSNFPKEEMYGLTSQIRRASVSITSNIAEGFGRHSYKEKAFFYHNALGSLIEVDDQLLIAKDVGYLSKLDFVELSSQLIKVQKLLRAFITKTRSFSSPSFR